MPKILERLVSQLKAKGVDKDSAWAIATKKLQESGNLKPGTREATAKGARRGKMTPGERAKDRAAKKSHHSSKEYEYHKKTNRATLRHGHRKT